VNSVWNDGWKCPRCETEYTAETIREARENFPDEDFSGEGDDHACPLHNPLGCGTCNVKCVPIGDDFTYNDDYDTRFYTDGRIITEWQGH
jgi:hypothetical protein